MRHILRTLLLASLFCATLPDARGDFLWEDGNQESLYADTPKRAFAVHDLITIAVEDRSFASVRGELTTDRRSRWESILREFVRLSTDSGSLKIKDALRAGEQPEIDVDDRFRTDNRAQTNRSTQITYTITAEVKQVLPNGTLVLEARTTKQVGEEREKVTLTGVARIEDITTANTIKAERLANLGLKVEGDGPVGDTQERGWLTKILDAIWPF